MTTHTRFLSRAPLLLPLLLLLLPVTATAAGFVKWEGAGEGLPLGAGKGVLEVAASGGEKTAVYAVVDSAGIFRSADLGKTWTALGGDAPCLKAPYAIAASPQNADVVFLSVATDGGGLWRSADGGKAWEKCGAKDKGLASDDVEWITFCAKDPNLVLVGHRAGKAISVSPDGGKTWAVKDLGAEIKNQLVFAISDTKWVVASRAGAGILWTENSGANWTAAQGSVDYFGGPLPVVQTEEYLFSSKHHGTNKSVDGGKNWQYTMERHARVIGTAGSLVFREDRAEIRGEEARIITIAMSEDYCNSWADVTGALTQLVPAALRKNIIIENKVDPFAHVRFATAWAALPAARTVFLALGPAGLYRGQLMWTEKGPRVPEAGVTPPALAEGDAKTKLRVHAVASGRAANVKKVCADLGALNLPDLELFDDGQHDDGAAGDKTFANSLTLPKGALAGVKVLGVVAEDEGGRLGSVMTRLEVSGAGEKMIVWDGDKFAHGLGWCSPQTPLNFLKAQTETAHEGKVALGFHGEGSGYVGCGWNWHGWYPENSGTDIRKFRNLSFWAKVEGPGEKPGGFSIGINCSTNKKATKKVNVADYEPDVMDGKWHEIVIPLKDILAATEPGFDLSKVWEMDIDTWSPLDRNLSVFIDELGFDNRMVRAHSEWVTLPEERAPAPLGANAAQVSADVDAKAEGRPISPYIYGASMGDRKVAQEAGLTILRAGGNPVTPLNWKHGFSNKGADWYYVNDGAETPPEKNWLVTFHGENKKANLDTYLTIPIMGRVAKDGTSVAFDIKKYPDQESWAGKAQPTDPHPNGGNGRQFVKGPDGKNQLGKDGKPALKDIEADPNDTSVEMPPEEQAQMLEFMIKTLNYGTADKGGVKYVALDNEPMLWSSTHRGMHPKGCSYEELWERTKTYGTLFKKIDPAVKLAGPTLWGWTAYFYSGLDAQLVGQGKGTWDDPPDHVEHGKVPLAKWYLKKLAEHEKATGQKLVDILDFHFYPQTGIYMSGKRNDPKVMEGRVQETRVLWDPQWKDPTWMGKETNKIIRLIPLMKDWIAECNPGMQTSIGEYSFGGEGDVSGGVAQAEILGVFAREGLDFGFLWLFPNVNSPHYFAFKLFRNPDGKHTAFGDKYLPGTCSAPEDVSVHAAKDSKTGGLTFVLVNKRAAKGAQVTLNLGVSVPAQDVVIYEYSAADKFCIGQLPPQKVSGEKLTVALPPMSVLRFDVKP